MDKRTQKPHGEERGKRECRTNQEAEREEEENGANTAEAIKQRQEQANRRIWRKVDKETFITGTTYRKRTTKMRNNTSMRLMGIRS